MMIEQCEVHPAESKSISLSLPLTHFDIPFLTSDPTQRLIFFKFQCSKSHFLETIAPQLKKSLSYTLKHYLPLTGKIIVPLNSNKPESRYVPGDSVSLTIKECDHQDLTYLTSNCQRVADEFYACVPQLPQPRHFPEYVEFHVMAIQITLFADQGICIGITNHHAMSDECSTIHFMKLWASINRFGGINNNPFIDDKALPCLDHRTKAQDPDGLDSRAWNLVRNSRVFYHDRKSTTTFPINRVRVTLIMTRKLIQQLKRYVVFNRPNLSHVSSFSVACTYIWSCHEKSDAEDAKYDDPVYFAFAAECRGKLNPPLPGNYFGNCIMFLVGSSKHGLLKGNEGFLTAAEAIGKTIYEGVHNDKGGILNRSHCPVDFEKFRGKRVISVAGSPRFDAYETDYGWGKPEKHELVHLDSEKSFSFIKSKEFEGGFEIGLSRNKIEMDAFVSNFNQGFVMNSVDEVVKEHS